MGLNKLGVLDLSFVTDTLVSLLRDCIDNWPLWSTQSGSGNGSVQKFAIEVTGAAPDSVRKHGQCQLSLYLFHVTPDPYQRNSSVVPDPYQQNSSVVIKRTQPIPVQPLSLNLYYLLSAYSAEDYHQEQQAMSIAMRCFHENPIVQVNVPIPGIPSSQTEEFTLTMEIETVDSLSRLWQSVTSPMRLAAVYKASVIFITPPAPDSGLAKEVKQINIGVDPSTLPFAASGQLIGSYRKVTYASPLSKAANPKIVSYDSSAATVAAGQTLILFGAGLSDRSRGGYGDPNPTARRLYLLMPDGSEEEVTSWIVPDTNPKPPPATIVFDSRLTIRLPLAPPTPGVYQLRVGSDIKSGDATNYRSNAVPIAIAAAVTGVPVPPDPPILTGKSFNGIGFLPGKTEVLLETIALSETMGALNPGNFKISGGGNSIAFEPPAGLASGLYGLRVRVNGIESDPSWWVKIP